MSTRLEYVTPSCVISFCNELDLAIESGSVEGPEDQDVLVLSYDECIVIPGTAAEILAFANRLIATVINQTGEDGRALPGDRECVHCGRELRYTAGVDPGLPWVHGDSGNGFCDVFGPADAVARAGTEGRTSAEPCEGWLDDYEVS